MPAVSVIIPVFRAEPYIAQCARSLFSQTLEDMEFVFIDDCSPDKSIDVLLQVLEKDFIERKPQVKILRMPENSGSAKVRMVGMSVATGDYVIHCDSDDELASADAYQMLYNKAVEENLDIVTCNYLKEDSSLRPVLVRERCDSVQDLLTDKVQGSLCCRLVRRALLNDIVPPLENMGEDLVLSIQATLRAHSFGHINEALYIYRYRASSISKEYGMQAAVRRHKGLVANVRMMVDLLTGSYSYSKDDPLISCFKYYSRHCIEPWVGNKECFALWKETFPEVDSRILLSLYLSVEKKIWFLLIHIHLYTPVKRMTHRLRTIRRR